MDWRNDGHPSYAVGKGATYDYQFTVPNRSGAYWYHPHPDGLTGRQAYLGLAGFFIVEDEDELRLRQSLDLELGATDIPLVIQDKQLTDKGDLRYTLTAEEQFTGFTGEVVVVNQVINPTLDVDSRVYRFRILNGSNQRVYRLALVKGAGSLPFHLIGTDGGLLSRPQRITEVFIGPAERVDILVDLRDSSPGDVLFFKSLSFDPMHNEMGNMGGMGSTGGMGGMGGMNMGGAAAASRLNDGDAFYILRLAVQKKAPYDLTIPSTLSQFTPLNVAGATTRPVRLSATMMQWLINGQRFNMEQELFRTPANSTEVWEVSNDTASMPHPMHLHGFQFQVQDRRNSPQQLQSLAIDGQGRFPTDLGWKDTVLVWPGETVRIAASFAHTFTGEQLFLFHCHNLEHEDAGMMVNYRVV